MKRRKNPNDNTVWLIAAATVVGGGVLYFVSRAAGAAVLADSTSTLLGDGQSLLGDIQGAVTDATVNLPVDVLSLPVDPDLGSGPAVAADPVVHAAHTAAVAARRTHPPVIRFVQGGIARCTGTSRYAVLRATTRVFASSAMVADATDVRLPAGSKVFLDGQPATGDPVPTGSLTTHAGSHSYAVSGWQLPTDPPTQRAYAGGYCFLAPTEVPSC